MENTNISTDSKIQLPSEQPLTHSSASISVCERANAKECKATKNDVDRISPTNAPPQSPQKRKQMQRSNITVTSSHRPIVNSIGSKSDENVEKINSNKRLKMDKPSHNLEHTTERKIISKPPLPPAAAASKQQHIARKVPAAPKLTNTDGAKHSSTSTDRTSLNSTVLVQKLENQTEQLRLEISELKQALATEKEAVRELR